MRAVLLSVFMLIMVMPGLAQEKKKKKKAGPDAQKLNVLSPQMATYIGGQTKLEEWTTVDIQPDGHIIVTGKAVNKRFPNEKWLLGGGYGVVLRIQPEPYKIVGAARLGDHIEDMEVGPNGEVAITGSFGVAVLNKELTDVVWHDDDMIIGTKSAQFTNQTPPFKNYRYTKRVARVAIADDGTVASFQANRRDWGDAPKHSRLYVWDKTGKRLSETRMPKFKYPKDLAISGEHKLIYVGGFNTYKHDSPHMKDHPIHMCFYSAFTYAGEEKWAAYDFPAKDVYRMNTYADCRVQRFQIGADGYLYMGGYIHGGDYIWKHDPFDVTKWQPKGVIGGYDSYSQAMGMGKGIDQAFVAKIDPKTGRWIRGQTLLTRQKPDGRGRPAQIQIKGIDADEHGNVYIAGYCEKYIKHRGQQVVAGQKVGEYYKPEMFVLQYKPNFWGRARWTVFAKEKSESAAWGLAVGAGRVAIVGEVYEGEVITTANAPKKQATNHVDGYLAYWSTDMETSSKPVESAPVEKKNSLE